MDKVSEKTNNLTQFKTLEKISGASTVNTLSSFKKTISHVKNFLAQAFSVKKILPKINLKPSYKAEPILPESKLAAASHKSFIQSLTTQETDVFLMKTIRLLKDHDIQFSTLTEQFKAIREVPINIIDDSPSITKAFSECIVAMQTIHTLPGETIEIKGSFKRFSQANCRSIPIPESFNLSAKSVQTGFPHPSQHHGWALSAAFIPIENPLKNQMKIISAELMPRGKFNLHAKALLKLKTAVFNKNAKKFLEMHYSFDLLRCKIAGVDDFFSIDEFYKKLNKQQNIFQTLSDVHSSCCTNYQSYQNLQIKVIEKIKEKKPLLLTESAVFQQEQFIKELNDFNISHDDMHHRLNFLLEQDHSHWLLHA